MGTALRLSFKVVCCEMVWRICRFMVLLDENERYGCAPTCPQTEWSNLWHFGFGLFEPGRLPDLTAFTDSRERT